jgi:Na+/melibiose symporter-like transporter
MQTAASITTVAHVIQLAVAPVFLLTGVGAILAVLINRLARVVDRFRVLERMLPAAGNDERAVLDTEMAILSRRARLIHWAISLCTVCALLICIVIATLFVGSVLGADLSGTIAVLFITAMLALIAGLLCFLREITLATGGIHVVGRQAGAPARK